MHLKGFILRKKKISSWNNTYFSKANVIYPKGINELKRLIKLLKKKIKIILFILVKLIILFRHYYNFLTSL